MGSLLYFGSAIQQIGDFSIEDPLVLLFDDHAYAVRTPVEQLMHLIRDSYRQLLLKKDLQEKKGLYRSLGKSEYPGNTYV